LAARNLEAIRSFLSKKEGEGTAAPPKRTRKKRRTGTWTDVIALIVRSPAAHRLRSDPRSRSRNTTALKKGVAAP
jgi:hypothetical protein